MTTELAKQCIHQKDTILMALKKLDMLSGDALVLFVCNNTEQVVGSLTDGDIRRALLRGAQPSTPLEDVMHTDFAFLPSDEQDHTQALRDLKERKISLIPLLDKEHHLLKIYNLQKIHSILPVDAVLMAGGKGERLRPLTEKTPKPLLPIRKKAIIDHNVDRLISYGIDHISVTVNYLKEQIIEHFAEPRQGVAIKTFVEPEFLGTIGSIQYVDNWKNDTVLVMNSDLYTDIDYEEFYLNFKQNHADMSVAAVPYTIAVPYGIMDLDGSILKGMVEKPTYNYYANGGIYLIKRELLKLIPRDSFFNATDFISLLIKEKRKVIRFPIKGTWIDIGNPQEYQKAKDLANPIL